MGCAPPAVSAYLSQTPVLQVGCFCWSRTSKSVPLLPLAPVKAKRKTAEGEERKDLKNKDHFRSG